MESALAYKKTCVKTISTAVAQQNGEAKKVLL